jgi:hypothetical protein
MDYKDTDFPQYRKLVNAKRFYKINGLNEFEEIQLMGSRTFHFLSKATQFPEKLRIIDMLSDPEEVVYLKSSENEWNKMFLSLR